VVIIIVIMFGWFQTITATDDAKSGDKNPPQRFGEITISKSAPPTPTTITFATPAKPVLESTSTSSRSLPVTEVSQTSTTSTTEIIDEEEEYESPTRVIRSLSMTSIGPMTDSNKIQPPIVAGLLPSKTTGQVSDNDGLPSTTVTKPLPPPEDEFDSPTKLIRSLSMNSIGPLFETKKIEPLIVEGPPLSSKTPTGPNDPSSSTDATNQLPPLEEEESDSSTKVRRSLSMTSLGPMFDTKKIEPLVVAGPSASTTPPPTTTTTTGQPAGDISQASTIIDTNDDLPPFHRSGSTETQSSTPIPLFRKEQEFLLQMHEKRKDEEGGEQMEDEDQVNTIHNDDGATATTTTTNPLPYGENASAHFDLNDGLSGESHSDLDSRSHAVEVSPEAAELRELTRRRDNGVPYNTDRLHHLELLMKSRDGGTSLSEVEETTLQRLSDAWEDALACRRELEELLNDEENGLEVDGERLYELELMERERLGESDFQPQKREDLEFFKLKRLDAREDAMDYKRMLDLKAKGMPIDEDQFYTIRLVEKRRMGQELTEGECDHVAAFEQGRNEKHLDMIEMKAIRIDLENGRPINEERYHFLKLLTRRWEGESLDEQESKELDFLCFRRDQQPRDSKDLELLLDKEARGEIVDENQLYLLDLKDRQGAQEILSPAELATLNAFQESRFKAFREEEELSRMLKMIDRGEKVDEARLHELQLRKKGDQLSRQETGDTGFLTEAQTGRPPDYEEIKGPVEEQEKAAHQGSQDNEKWEKSSHGSQDLKDVRRFHQELAKEGLPRTIEIQAGDEPSASSRISIRSFSEDSYLHDLLAQKDRREEERKEEILEEALELYQVALQERNIEEDEELFVVIFNELLKEVSENAREADRQQDELIDREIRMAALKRRKWEPKPDKLAADDQKEIVAAVDPSKSSSIDHEIRNGIRPSDGDGIDGSLNVAVEAQVTQLSCDESPEKIPHGSEDSALLVPLPATKPSPENSAVEDSDVGRPTNAQNQELQEKVIDLPASPIDALSIVEVARIDEEQREVPASETIDVLPKTSCETENKEGLVEPTDRENQEGLLPTGHTEGGFPETPCGSRQESLQLRPDDGRNLSSNLLRPQRGPLKKIRDEVEHSIVVTPVPAQLSAASRGQKVVERKGGIVERTIFPSPTINSGASANGLLRRDQTNLSRQTITEATPMFHPMKIEGFPAHSRVDERTGTSRQPTLTEMLNGDERAYAEDLQTRFRNCERLDTDELFELRAFRRQRQGIALDSKDAQRLSRLRQGRLQPLQEDMPQEKRMRRKKKQVEATSPPGATNRGAAIRGGSGHDSQQKPSSQTTSLTAVPPPPAASPSTPSAESGGFFGRFSALRKTSKELELEEMKRRQEELIRQQMKSLDMEEEVKAMDKERKIQDSLVQEAVESKSRKDSDEWSWETDTSYEESKPKLETIESESECLSDDSSLSSSSLSEGVALRPSSHENEKDEKGLHRSVERTSSCTTASKSLATMESAEQTHHSRSHAASKAASVSRASSSRASSILSEQDAPEMAGISDIKERNESPFPEQITTDVTRSIPSDDESIISEGSLLEGAFPKEFGRVSSSSGSRSGNRYIRSSLSGKTPRSGLLSAHLQREETEQERLDRLMNLSRHGEELSLGSDESEDASVEKAAQAQKVPKKPVSALLEEHVDGDPSKPPRPWKDVIVELGLQQNIAACMRELAHEQGETGTDDLYELTKEAFDRSVFNFNESKLGDDDDSFGESRALSCINEDESDGDSTTVDMGEKGAGESAQMDSQTSVAFDADQSFSLFDYTGVESKLASKKHDKEKEFNEAWETIEADRAVAAQMNKKRMMRLRDRAPGKEEKKEEGEAEIPRLFLFEGEKVAGKKRSKKKRKNRKKLDNRLSKEFRKAMREVFDSEDEDEYDRTFGEQVADERKPSSNRSRRRNSLGSTCDSVSHSSGSEASDEEGEQLEEDVFDDDYLRRLRERSMQHEVKEMLYEKNSEVVPLSDEESESTEISRDRRVRQRSGSVASIGSAREKSYRKKRKKPRKNRSGEVIYDGIDPADVYTQEVEKRKTRTTFTISDLRKEMDEIRQQATAAMIEDAFAGIAAGRRDGFTDAISPGGAGRASSTVFNRGKGFKPSGPGVDSLRALNLDARPTLGREASFVTTNSNSGLLDGGRKTFDSLKKSNFGSFANDPIPEDDDDDEAFLTGSSASPLGRPRRANIMSNLLLSPGVGKMKSSFGLGAFGSGAKPPSKRSENVSDDPNQEMHDDEAPIKKKSAVFKRKNTVKMTMMGLAINRRKPSSQTALSDDEMEGGLLD